MCGGGRGVLEYREVLLGWGGLYKGGPDVGKTPLSEAHNPRAPRLLKLFPATPPQVLMLILILKKGCYESRTKLESKTCQREADRAEARCALSFAGTWYSGTPESIPWSEVDGVQISILGSG